MQFVNNRPNHNYNNNTYVMPYTVYYKKPVQNNIVIQTSVRSNNVENPVYNIQPALQNISQNVIDSTILNPKKKAPGYCNKFDADKEGRHL